LAKGFELGAQCPVVVYLAIEGDDEVAVDVSHLLGGPVG
jgi:hypothetical protein